jgi:acyl-CoA thioesterase FadM
MARIKLAMPEEFRFVTELEVRIGDINYGNHLGHDALISLLHEARVRFLASFGWTELNCGGKGLILNDLAVVYKSDSFYGDQLKIKVEPVDIQPAGFDLCYRVEQALNGTLIAEAKTGMIAFDYSLRKVSVLPESVSKAYLKVLNETQL